MNKLRNILAALLVIIASSGLHAQENAPVEMADSLFQSGKIYVVVIVVAILFVGFFAYLVSLDRKLNKIEKENNLKK